MANASPLTLKRSTPLGAAISFFLFKVVLSALSVWWAVELARGRRGPPAGWMLALILILGARPIVSDLQHGNINIIVLFLVIAGLMLFSRNRTLAGGFLVGFAVVVKVTPGLFLPYFAYKREWRMLAGCGLGIVLSVAAPTLILGPRANMQMHQAWFDQMVVPYLVHGEVEYAEHINQSLPGVAMRLLSERDSADAETETETESVEYVPVKILSLDRGTVRGIIRISGLVLLGWLAFVCRGRISDRRDWRYALEFGLILIAMLILSERTWKHHFVTIILPIASVVYHLAAGPASRPMRRYLIVTLALFFALTILTSGELIGWIHAGVAHKFVEAYGSFFFAGALLFASLCAIRLAESPSEAHRPPPPEAPRE